MSLPTGGIATAAVGDGAASSMGPGPGGEAEPRSRAVAGEAVEGGRLARCLSRRGSFL